MTDDEHFSGHHGGHHHPCPIPDIQAFRAARLAGRGRRLTPGVDEGDELMCRRRATVAGQPCSRGQFIEAVDRAFSTTADRMLPVRLGARSTLPCRSVSTSPPRCQSQRVMGGEILTQPADFHCPPGPSLSCGSHRFTDSIMGQSIPAPGVKNVPAATYRQLRDLTGLDDDGLAVLLALEVVGLRDWPGVYERWCLVSLLNVLQNDFRFKFNANEVRTDLLKYCAGTSSGSFSAHAFRKDIDLELTLHYQPKFRNGRVPDFLLEIRRKMDNVVVSSVRCVLDAKACNFVPRPGNAKPNDWIYLDDCLKGLIDKKDYGEAGENLVFIMHACENTIAHPTTSQPWAKASSYGGDAVYYWEVEGDTGVI